MSNFDLRKYLAESKLVTEDKIDMINQYAKRIATGEEIQDKFFMKNKKEILDTATEIEKYMNSDIDMEEVKKPSTKMTRRELKEMIKDAFIAEAETDAEYFYSPVREDLDEADAQINIVTTMDGKTIVGTHQYGVGFKSNEAGKKMGFNDHPTSIPNGTKMSEDDSLYETEVASEDEIEDIIYVIDRITRGLNDPYNESKIAEAKDEEEEMDITVDAEEETDGGEEAANDSIVVDKKIVSLSSLPNDTRKILDALEILRSRAAQLKLNGSKESSFQESAQKLIDQVRNTIIFFTREFVGGSAQPTKAKVDESDDMEEGKKSNKQKLIDAGYSESDAEDFVDEFKQGGVKVPQKVKDILSDKSSMNESMFPMWKKLNKIK